MLKQGPVFFAVNLCFFYFVVCFFSLFASLVTLMCLFIYANQLVSVFFLTNVKTVD